MRSLYEITVTVQTGEEIGDPKHDEITIEPAVDAENTDDFFPPGAPDDDVRQQLRDAGRSHAATLARLGLDLVPWIDRERKEHGCSWNELPRPGWREGWPPSWEDACHLSHRGLVEPGIEECYQPSLWLLVPTGKRKEWLKRIADTLGLIAADRELRPQEGP